MTISKWAKNHKKCLNWLVWAFFHIQNWVGLILIGNNIINDRYQNGQKIIKKMLELVGVGFFHIQNKVGLIENVESGSFPISPYFNLLDNHVM